MSDILLLSVDDKECAVEKLGVGVAWEAVR
jgi:hypothetical protein